MYKSQKRLDQQHMFIYGNTKIRKLQFSIRVLNSSLGSDDVFDYIAGLVCVWRMRMTLQDVKWYKCFNSCSSLITEASQIPRQLTRCLLWHQTLFTHCGFFVMLCRSICNNILISSYQRGGRTGNETA